MELRLLEYFVAVCEELHFTRAAEKLNISQPTLSQQIRILESNVGSQLFNRVGKKVYISQAGEILLHHAKKIFNEIDEARNKISDLHSLNHGKITIGCTGSYMLETAIFSFNEIYPNIEICLIDIPTKEIIDNVKNNQFDIGIVFLPLNDEQLESKLLLRTEFVLVVSHQHELAKFPFVRLKDLVNTPLNLLPKNYFTRQNLDNFCRKEGFTLKPTFELSSIHSLFQMAVHNKGATLLPTSFVNKISDDRVRQIPIIDPFPQSEMGIIYRKDKVISTKFRTIVDFLLKEFQEES